MGLGSKEILIIFLVVLVLFGAKRIPEVFKAFGSGIKEFKKAASDIEKEIASAQKDEPPAPRG